MAEMIISGDYKQWLSELKKRIRQSQIKASVKVNTVMLQMYWELGRDIATRQLDAKWGSGFLSLLSKDLRKEFPQVDGFSLRNLKYIRQWYLFYAKDIELGQQAVAQLGSDQHREVVEAGAKREKRQQFVARVLTIPWGHNILIITKCKSVDEALFYVGETLEYGWSRNVLLNMLDTGLYEAKGKSLNNFSRMLPAPMSDLAQQTLKDPYRFDFLALREEYDERELDYTVPFGIGKRVFLCRTSIQT